MGDKFYANDTNGKGQSLILTHHYESHSKMVDMIFDGIDSKEWTNDKIENSQGFDKMVNSYLGNVFWKNIIFQKYLKFI